MCDDLDAVDRVALKQRLADRDVLIGLYLQIGYPQIEGRRYLGMLQVPFGLRDLRFEDRAGGRDQRERVLDVLYGAARAERGAFRVVGVALRGRALFRQISEPLQFALGNGQVAFLDGQRSTGVLFLDLQFGQFGPGLREVQFVVHRIDAIQHDTCGEDLAVAQARMSRDDAAAHLGNRGPHPVGLHRAVAHGGRDQIDLRRCDDPHRARGFVACGLSRRRLAAGQPHQDEQTHRDGWQYPQFAPA